MTDQSAENKKIISDLNNQGIDASEILGMFQLDTHECLAVRLSTNDSPPPSSDNVPNAQLITELCRFQVDGYECVILEQECRQDNDEINLSLVLTARELQIASLIALGYPNKKVANKLKISPWTVAEYLKRIYAKLGVESRAAMTYRCASLISSQDELISSLKKI